MSNVQSLQTFRTRCQGQEIEPAKPIQCHCIAAYPTHSHSFGEGATKSGILFDNAEQIFNAWGAGQLRCGALERGMNPKPVEASGAVLLTQPSLERWGEFWRSSSLNCRPALFGKFVGSS